MIKIVRSIILNKKILKSTLLSLSLISTLSLSTLVSAETNSNVVAPNKVAVVNVRTIIDKSGLMQNTQKEFSKENKTQIAQFQKSQKELQQKQADFQKNQAILRQKDKRAKEEDIKKLVVKLQKEERDLQLSQQKIGMKLQKELLTKLEVATMKVAKKDGYTSVLDAQVVLYPNGKGNDITDAVLKAMK